MKVLCHWTVIVACFLSTNLALAERAPIEVGSKKQLFVDDRFVAESTGLEWTMNPPRKAGVVLRPLPEREGNHINVSTVFEVDGEYWMYYGLYVPDDWSKRDWPNVSGHARHLMCLATSKDGIHWERKQVGLFDVGRGRDNAIVMPGAMGTVFIDPKQTRGSRFWYLGSVTETPWWDESAGAVYKLDVDGKRGGAIYLCHSPDGVRWKRVKEPLLPFWCDTRNQVFFDPRLQRYVGYVRGRLDGLRVVCRGESDRLDRMPWPFQLKPQTTPGPRGLYGGVNHREWPVVMQPDDCDPPQTDLYGSDVTIYPWAEDVYLAFPSVYRHYDGFKSHGRDHRGRYGNDGPAVPQLSVSRDGINWRRFRRPYVRLGLIDEVDGGSTSLGVGMIRRGNEIWQYYAGARWTHGNYEDHPEWSKAVVRVVQRLDGFVSLDADPNGGELLTPPIIFTGNRLQLNIDCGAMGEAWVEIQDADGKPIPGFSLADAVSVDRNGVAQEVWWRQGPKLDKLAGRPIRLRIKMRSAKLYAFQFAQFPFQLRHD